MSIFSSKENTESLWHDTTTEIDNKNHQCILLIKYLLNKRQGSGSHVFDTFEYFKLMNMELASCF